MKDLRVINLACIICQCLKIKMIQALESRKGIASPMYALIGGITFYLEGL